MIILNLDLTTHQTNIYRRMLNYDKNETIRLSLKQLGLNRIDGEYNIILDKANIKKLCSVLMSKNKRGFEIDINPKNIYKVNDIKLSKTDITNNKIKEIIHPIHSLSNFEIEDYFKLVGIKGGVYSKDNVPNKIGVNSCYIINLDDSGNDGTHWVLLMNKKTEKTILYFDSFGVKYPPKSILEMKTNKLIVCNNKKIQDINSLLCGYYCLKLALECLVKDKKYIDVINHFDYDKSNYNKDLADDLYI